MKRTFFRFYVDRVFSVKGSGTVVTGTVLGKKLSLKRRFYSSFTKRDKNKNIQVHNQNAIEANILLELH